MRIAVLGWGSLVWDPTGSYGAILQIAPGARWSASGPMLPVEFARISKDGRLTLVVLPEYEHRCQVLWITSGHQDVQEAIGNLAAREGIHASFMCRSIHGVLATGETLGNVLDQVADPVQEWMSDTPALDAAIWTGLGAGKRWQKHGYDGFTVTNALDYLNGLEGEVSRLNAEYLRKTPPSIDTPVRQLAPL